MREKHQGWTIGIGRDVDCFCDKLQKENEEFRDLLGRREHIPGAWLVPIADNAFYHQVLLSAEDRDKK